MLKFFAYEADVLVATTLIENGLDVRRANTLIVDRADRFGLAELHQLRGRVGRSSVRAYAYLMLEEHRTLSDIAGRRLQPASLMMSYGYKPELSEGALKSPIFQTSTFVFRTAEEGKAFFEVAYGLREKAPSEEMGLIYSRLNNPDLEILQDQVL